MLPCRGCRSASARWQTDLKWLPDSVHGRYVCAVSKPVCKARWGLVLMLEIDGIHLACCDTVTASPSGFLILPLFLPQVLQWLVTFGAVNMRMAGIPKSVWNNIVRRGVVPLAKLAGFRAFEDEYVPKKMALAIEGKTLGVVWAHRNQVQTGMGAAARISGDRVDQCDRQVKLSVIDNDRQLPSIAATCAGQQHNQNCS